MLRIDTERRSYPRSKSRGFGAVERINLTVFSDRTPAHIVREDGLGTASIPILSSNIKRRAQDFAKAVVFHRTPDVDGRINFFRIYLPVREAALTDIGFNDLTDDEKMAFHIQGMEDLALKVYRTFLYERSRFQFTVESFKNL